MSQGKRYAIITPYHKEKKWLLQRCMASVRSQTVPVDQFMVADGFPQDWIDREPVRHMKLDREHRDNGNAARGVGALLAISEQYDGIGLLDASNWLEAGHVAKCVAASERIENCDYVVSGRNLCRPDGSVMNMPDDATAKIPEANCFFFLTGSYHLIPQFSLIPGELSALSDGIFYQALKFKNLNGQVLQDKTVNVHCLWKSAYDALGETAPASAKPAPRYREFRDWLGSRSVRELHTIYNRCGSKILIR